MAMALSVALGAITGTHGAAPVNGPKTPLDEYVAKPVTLDALAAVLDVALRQ